MKKICCILILLFLSTLSTTSAQEKLLQFPSTVQESVLTHEVIQDDLVYHGEEHEFHDLLYRGEEITIVKLSENECE